VRKLFAAVWMKSEKGERKIRKSINFRNLFFIFLVVLVIILIFTFLDYLIHLLKEDYSVPFYYFINKIIFGTGIGFIVYLFVREKRLLTKSLIFSAVISVLLQMRYFLEGFSIKFVLEFLIIHFFILVVLSLIIFRLFKNKI